MLLAGDGVEGTPEPMHAMSAHFVAQARAWTEGFAASLGTCGNPTLDGAITTLGQQLRGGAATLSGASNGAGTYVTTCSANFVASDQGGSQ